MSTHETCTTNCGSTYCHARVLRDPTLETLSDKVRKGEPIDFLEALAVIKYQENLRREREANSLVARLKRWLRAA